MSDDKSTSESASLVERLAERRQRNAQILALVEAHPDEIMSHDQVRELLKDLSGTLSAVNWILFGLVSWIAFAVFAPVLNDDTRPSWSLWLIFGPLFGVTFGGLGSAIVWTLSSRWLGGFMLDRQNKPISARRWRAFISTNWDRFRD